MAKRWIYYEGIKLTAKRCWLLALVAALFSALGYALFLNQPLRERVNMLFAGHVFYDIPETWDYLELPPEFPSSLLGARPVLHNGDYLGYVDKYGAFFTPGEAARDDLASTRPLLIFLMALLLIWGGSVMTVFFLMVTPVRYFWNKLKPRPLNRLASGS